MKSTRLPGKILKKIGNKTLLEHVINQTRHSSLVDDVIIATTISKNDDVIEKFCTKINQKFFRGSEDDVLDRYYQCARKYDASIIVRITSDCPFIDPDIIDAGIRKFLDTHVDYIGNNIAFKNGKWNNDTCNYPQGNTVEVCTLSTLKKAWMLAKKPSEREHVFPFVQFNPNIFKITNFSNNEDLSHIRCTVDRIDDLQFVRKVYDKISNNRHVIRTHDILDTLKNYPNILNLNNHIPFDEGYKISLKKDNEFVLFTNKRKKIILVADGDVKIGLGHFYRMINLAKFLSRNYEISFLTNNKSELLKLTNKFRIEPFSRKNSHILEIKLNLLKPDIIIIDKHKESTDNLKIMKKICPNLISIDYTGNNINHIKKNFEILYHNEKTNTKSIFENSILSNDILIQKPIKIKKEINNIVVLQGGSDTHCFTPKIVNSLKNLPCDVKTSVVLGSCFSCHDKIQKTLMDFGKKIKLVNNVKNMGSFLKNFDLAITAGGITLLELAYLGVPSIIICGEKFEEKTAKIIESMGYGINLGFGRNVSENKIYHTTKNMIINYRLRKKMNRNGRKLIDGKGLLRITEFIRDLD
jgi:spore coat polysaccharide biosynthesis protein SpsF